jgi:glycosyltransferase involved in cell wall biosynthesis
MIHVAIDARLPDKGQGGVQQVIRSLAEGFRLNPNHEIIRSWIVYKGTKWWNGVFPPEDTLIELTPPFGKASIMFANRLPKTTSRLFPLFSKLTTQKPQLDLVLSSRNIDLVHMPFQDGFITEFPYIYHPHDLQHEYFPEYFTKSQLQHRNSAWRSLAVNATLVMAATSLVREDLISKWHIESQKIKVVPIPPPTRPVPENRNGRYAHLDYFLYPAVFWRHKNHIALVEAMRILILEHPNVHLVFVGTTGPEEKRIREQVARYRLGSNIHFGGHVPDSEYGLILKESLCVVIPSLFEALSLTVADARYFGKPVICSDLPFFKFLQTDDLSFCNPHDEKDIAKKMEMKLLNLKDTDIRFDDQLEVQHQEDLKNLSFQFSDLYVSLIANR